MPHLDHAVQSESLTSEHIDRLPVDFNLGENFFVPVSAAWIGVRDINQLSNGPLPISDHMRWQPLRYRDDIPVDDQHAVVLTRDETLDEHQPIAALGGSRRVIRTDRVLISEIRADTTSMISIERFEHHGVSDVVRGRDGLVNIRDNLAMWRWN